MVGAKRFYKAAAVAATTEGFTVALDGKPAQTPGGRALVVPGRLLAAALAEEWQAQEKTIESASMPLNGLVNTALDRLAGQRGEVLHATLGYVETDLLCYRAPEPHALAARQAGAWQPLLDWFEEAHGVGRTVTEGVVAVPQSGNAVEVLRPHLDAMDDLTLAALSVLTQTCGSLVIALAVHCGRLTAEEAFEVSQLDESYQMERWGQDPEALRRRQRLREDILTVGNLLSMLDPAPNPAG